jgi:type II secretory pathway pseudopilin PulG
VRNRIPRDLIIVAAFVVAIIGALAVCAVPNLYTAIQRSKQKRTYATLRDWGLSVDAYQSTHGHYPRPGYYGSIAGLTPLISGKLPVVDGWGYPLIYHASKSHYAIRSTARDGINDRRVDPGLTKRLDDDLLYADGGFVRVMDGICGSEGSTDDWDVKKYGECASCHPAHVRHS